VAERLATAVVGHLGRFGVILLAEFASMAVFTRDV